MKFKKSGHLIQSDYAREHLHGGSISGTTAWKCVLAKSRQLKKKQAYQNLAIQEFTQAGVPWPTDRIVYVLAKEELCKNPVEDCWCAFWTCAKLHYSEEESFIKSHNT